jgi:hypothetical protein
MLCVCGQLSPKWQNLWTKTTFCIHLIHTININPSKENVMDIKCGYKVNRFCTIRQDITRKNMRTKHAKAVNILQTGTGSNKS